MIEFRNVTKRWTSGLIALDSVSFSAPRGQFCVVLGPSGAGKSSLLRSVNGLLQADSGEVLIDSEPLEASNLMRKRTRIGMIHQHFSLSPRLSVANNVLSGSLPELGLFRSLSGWFTPEQRARACELLAQVGLTPAQLHQRAGDLSGGQQQRVGVARAFMMRPDIILADEPVASLDPKVSVDILELIRTAARATQTTVLCSLHQVDLACQFADRIVGLRHGKLILDVPANQFTAAHARSLYEGVSPAAGDSGSPAFDHSSQGCPQPAFELARA
jgi:phosphonate transport system ATP-binding protein